jgi:hypothetical protein
MVVGFATTYMQLVPITNNIMNSDPALGGMYPIQHYVIKFVSDLRHVGIDAINKITKLLII